MEAEQVGERERGFIEGFAAALQAMQYTLTGDCGCNKSYDPMVIGGNTMHSYAFDMLDGGRHHSFEPYSDVGDICQTLYAETIDNLKSDELEIVRNEPVDSFLTALHVREGNAK